MMCQLLVASVFISFQATADAHCVLDVWVALVREVSFRCVLAALLGDALFIRVAIFRQMRNREAMILAWAIHNSSNLTRFPWPCFCLLPPRFSVLAMNSPCVCGSSSLMKMDLLCLRGMACICHCCVEAVFPSACS